MKNMKMYPFPPNLIFLSQLVNMQRLSIKRIIKPIIRKYDSKLIAKKSYTDLKNSALSFGFVKTYDERIIKKENVINKTDLFQSGFIFILNI